MQEELADNVFLGHYILREDSEEDMYQTRKHHRNGNSQENKHNKYLEELIYHLATIEEPAEQVQWIMKDGIWFKESMDCDRKKFCDLLIMYQDYGVPVELKGSRHKREHALAQINNGRLFIENILHLPVPYGKFVTYEHHSYQTETIIFTKR